MKYILRRAFFIIFVIAFLAVILFSVYTFTQQKNIAGSVLRLHVTANSDSAYDQLIKLSIRDCIFKEYGSIFSGCDSSCEAVKKAEAYSGEMQRTAEKELEKFGVLYPVSVQVKNCTFPAKAYGGVTLPAGRYTALNISLGEGNGRNWWCVMYPALCLSGNTAEADTDTLDRLKKELSAGEYALITENGEINVKMKFKLLEIIERFR